MLLYKGITVFQSVADNYTDPKSSNTSQTYVGIADQQKEGKQSRDDSIQLYPHILKSNPAQNLLWLILNELN